MNRKLRREYYVRILVLLIVSIFLSCSQKKGEQQQVQELENAKSEIVHFDFDGNYLPTESISVNDHLFNSIEIFTQDSVGTRVIELIYLRFTNIANEEYRVVKTSFNGTKESFFINANDSILGQLAIKGQFFGVKGPRNDDLKNSKTIVFSGEFLANGIKNKLECTYFEGD